MRYLLITGVLLLAAACSPAEFAEDIANQALEDQGVSVDLDGDQITVEGPDGTVTAGGGLPEGFPADFPLPDGAEAIAGASGAGRDITATFQVGGQSAADVQAFYTDALPAAGYTVASSTGGTDGSVFSIEGNGWQGQVIVGNQVSATVTVSLDRLE